MRPLALVPVVPLAFALSSSTALAHIQLEAPTARWTDQKAGPCGRANGARTDRVSRFQPGATITVQWRETIDHPGHYRIAFDEDGDDDFPVPASFTDTSGGPTVLHDGIPDRPGGGAYSVEVTLPDVECDNCTLQLIQMMTDKPPYGDGNDLYYQCADLVLAGDAPDGGQLAEPLEPTPDVPGCRCVEASPGPGTGALLLGVLGLGFAVRRRRR